MIRGRYPNASAACFREYPRDKRHSLKLHVGRALIESGMYCHPEWLAIRLLESGKMNHRILIELARIF